jgi:uncharacterized protein YutE (UPF0331/DUF86 family)
VTDTELLEKKLAFIETCVRELRELSQPERIETDIREERFVAHTLQMAIQAALDIASHIVSDARLGEPRTNRELFDLLQRHAWLSLELTDIMGKMAGFRNIVVHGYQSVDPRIMRDIVENRLDDLLAFTTAIKTRLLA